MPSRSIHAGDIIHALNDVFDFFRVDSLHCGYCAVGTALGRRARAILGPGEKLTSTAQPKTKSVADDATIPDFVMNSVCQFWPEFTPGTKISFA